MRTVKHPTKGHQHHWGIWKWPVGIAAATTFTLVGALFEDDGWLDVGCAIVLGATVALGVWCWLIRPRINHSAK
ncbi:hypothetical protein LIN78_10265 [Leeia sp. TBRC 13508]|uniref:DUF4175 domain-containing protein n=1 Tax=Leeia speluncae TaxID=2884804 RepID=A0ABS8D701_9NEIS|nr:hypothetical protein [Leeia speluncae]MCB6183927.1 hypothetical protein [Leeia speluncae]